MLYIWSAVRTVSPQNEPSIPVHVDNDSTNEGIHFLPHKNRHQKAVHFRFRISNSILAVFMLETLKSSRSRVV